MSTSLLNHLSRLTKLVTAFALAAGLLAPVTTPAADNVGATEAPLIIGHRNIHVFRGNLGDLTPSERADAARHHI